MIYIYSYSCSYSHKEKNERLQKYERELLLFVVFKTKEYHYIQQIKCSMEEDKLKQDRKESKGK